jgi:hypothetical protein
LWNSHKWSNDRFSLIETTQFNGCKIIGPYPESRTEAFLYKLFKEIGLKNNFVYLISKNEKMRNIHFEAFGEFNMKSFIYKFYEMETALVYATGEEYNPYEKLLLPFQLESWICCGIVFGCGMLVIFLINLINNKRIRILLFGRHVESPAFNILVAFFGQTQHILPRRSFARFLLMLLILSCLIIRTGYQGVQFDMMYMVSLSI